MKKFYFFLSMHAMVLSVMGQNCIRVTAATFTNPSNDGITWKLSINYNTDGNKTLVTTVKLGSLVLLNDCFSTTGTGVKVYDNIIAANGNILLSAEFVPRTGACGSAQCGPIQILPPGGGLLPVQLSSFVAQRYKQTVQLNWTTTAEINAASFIIEKSRGNQFEPVATVAAVGLSSTLQQYAYTDKNVERNTSFYRLKIVDRDGAFTYSSVKKINGNNEIDINIYPNPIINNSKVTIEGVQPNASIAILDISGKRINQFLLGQQNTFTLPSLQKGFYLLKITEPSTNNIVVKKIYVTQ